MKSRTKTSPKMVTTPAPNISLRTSMSLVTRVISRPTGLASKKRSDRRCMWENSSTRMSNITRCASQVVRMDCTYWSTKDSASAPVKHGGQRQQQPLVALGDGAVQHHHGDPRAHQLQRRPHEQQGTMDPATARR